MATDGLEHRYRALLKGPDPLGEAWLQQPLRQVRTLADDLPDDPGRLLEWSAAHAQRVASEHMAYLEQRRQGPRAATSPTGPCLVVPATGCADQGGRRRMVARRPVPLAGTAFSRVDPHLSRGSGGRRSALAVGAGLRGGLRQSNCVSAMAAPGWTMPWPSPAARCAGSPRKTIGVPCVRAA